MGDVVQITRAAARPMPRAFEDQRWVERHAPEASATAAVVPDCICTAGHRCRHNRACPRAAISTER